MKTVGYIRVSTDEQANHGVSLDAQRQKLEQYAALYDLELIDIIEDAGQSAKSLKRPGIQRALEMLRKSEAECILVVKLDRLTRNLGDFRDLIKEFFLENSKRRCFLKSVTDSIDTTSANGRFFLHIQMAQAEWERDSISERTKAALQHKKSNLNVYGPVPFGYDRVGDALVLNQDEKETIELIVSWSFEGWGSCKIATQLNENGYKTKGGGKWYQSTVEAILRNGLNGG